MKILKSVDFGIARCEFNEETEGKFRTLIFVVVFFIFVGKSFEKQWFLRNGSFSTWIKIEKWTFLVIACVYLIHFLDTL